MKKYIINGASGFIGFELINKLSLQQDNEIYALTSTVNGRLSQMNTPNLKVFNYDFANNYQFSKILPKQEYEAFIYLAWNGYGGGSLSKDKNDYRIQTNNIPNLLNSIKEAKEIGVKKFVYASSFSEFMISENEQRTHKDGAPSNIYGASKKAARLLGQALSFDIKIDFTSFSLANTFGPGDKSLRSTNLFIQKMIKNLPIDLTHGNHLYDWNFIDDAIEGIIQVINKGLLYRNYYIGNHARSLKDIIFDVKKIISSTSEIYLGKYLENFHVDYKSVDFYELSRDTGYFPKVPFTEAILRTRDWVKRIFP
jgi:nucleoside-diphosphate-sugar epimerase